ncbi:hypothetical protein ACO0LO_04495 [Undibacterium sp. TJN25]|uniref:hypothetical protein n=1 Tax=Undibacterium sp. TJN25 TaxID=3413056 RepID=UPI003BF1DC52
MERIRIRHIYVDYFTHANSEFLLAAFIEARSLATLASIDEQGTAKQADRYRAHAVSRISEATDKLDELLESILRPTGIRRITMKTKQLIAAAVLTLSGAAAFAAGFGDEPYVNYPPTTGAVKAVADTKTPAELQTEQSQAHASNLLIGGKEIVSNSKYTGNTASRTEVKSETMQAAVARFGSRNTKYIGG